MAKIEFKGLDKYIDKVAKLYDDIEPICKQAVYDGAGVIADAIRAEIEALPVARETFYATGDQKLSGVTPLQKQGLLDGLGVSQMRNNAGTIDTKIGFNGYNNKKTKKYPSGQPNLLVARSVISGASFRDGKIPFVRNAVKSAKAKAEKAMADKFDEAANKIIK